MSFYSLFSIVFSLLILCSSVPIAFSIENENNGLSYTTKNCDNESCIETTCFENKPCIIKDSKDLPIKSTSSNDETRQLLDDFDLKDLEFMDIFDNFYDFK